MADPLKIQWWAADQSGCGMYRCGIPAAHLKAQGLADTLASTRLDLSVEWDVIVAQRTTGGPQSQLWQELAQRDILAVFEIDDDMWSIPEDNPAHAFYTPQRLGELSDNLAASHLVTVTTDALAAVVKEHTDAPVAVLPNCIDLSVFGNPVDQSSYSSIGWGGSTTHHGDIAPVAGLLRRAADRTDAEFVTIGADYSSLIKARKQRHVGWQKEIYDFYLTLDFNVGVAPLADNTFNLSKSPLKALEYAARGIVTVASDVGPYSGFVRHGETGFLVKEDHEWEKYVRRLANDPVLRNKMAKNGLEQAKQYDINVRAKDWLDAFNETLLERGSK